MSGCAWPTTDTRPWRFCDAPPLTGKQYCADHCAKAFVPTTHSAVAVSWTVALRWARSIDLAVPRDVNAATLAQWFSHARQEQGLRPYAIRGSARDLALAMEVMA